MATARNAASALFATIEQTGGTITDILSTVSTGAKMLNDITTDAREKQLMNIKVSRVGYEDMLLVSKTKEIDASRQSLAEYIGNDPIKQDRCDKIWAELKAALN